MGTILSQAKDFGIQQSQGRSVMAHLAVAVAKAAEAGEIDEDSATDIYSMYIRMAHRVSKLDTSETTVRVQISKLRQIIKMGMEFGAGPLLKVMRLHPELSKEGKVKWLYASMVDVARAQLARPSPLTDKQIAVLIQANKGRRR
jgi:hypothetical protein